MLYIKLRKCHNPYFNRWFSAMRIEVIINVNKNSHNPYFNRWFSAIHLEETTPAT